MSDTTVTSESWLSRLVGSIIGVFFGALLVIASIAGLFWNEGRAVRASSSLKTGAHEVVSISPNKVDPANEGRLVYTTGEASSSEMLTDANFGLGVQAIRFIRKVEMYQWKEERKTETRKKLGGGTESVTTYTYANVWSPTLIDSASFHEAAGHQNPATMPVVGASWTAQTVTLGAFTLSPEQVAKLDQTQEVPVDGSPGHPVPAGMTVDQGGYYRGANPATPAVGDERISFEVVHPATISLVARQVGHSFEPDRTTADPILMLTYGTVSADDMFKTAETQNTTLTWIVRGGGFVAMLIGFVLVFRPLVTVADVVPLIGSLLGAGTFLVGFFMALSLSVLTIGVAWIAYRPLLGVLLLVAAVAAILLLHRFAVEKRAARA
ncbi:MAG TPA: TMEM43 family protein [Vicinamibacterales bacterium]